MKKIKANSILATFILGVSIFLLCSFGTDAAYVILSRYKLQKITESLAFEYASILADGKVENTEENNNHKQSSCKELAKVYRRIYDRAGTGILVFDVQNMEYKADRVNDEIAVKVQTTSKVYPAFLKFVGVKQIKIYGVARAKTQTIQNEAVMEENSSMKSGTDKITIKNGILSFISTMLELALPGSGTTESTDTPSTSKYKYADTKETLVEFFAPFVDKNDPNKRAMVVTAKDNGVGDFKIGFKYATRASWWSSTEEEAGTNGGYFILAGYEAKDDTGADEIRWVDIGDKIKEINIDMVKRVCANAGDWADYMDTTEFETETQCYYCVNPEGKSELTFDLALANNSGVSTGGQTKRFTHLRVYKAGGSGEQLEDGKYQDPCDPSAIKQKTDEGTWALPSIKYFNRKAIVTFKILNDVSLINKRQYNDFVSRSREGQDDNIAGMCQVDSPEAR